MKHVIIAGASGYIGKKLLEVIKEYDNIKATALCISRDEFKGFIVGDNIEIITNEEFFSSTLIYKDSYLVNLAFPREDNIEIILNASEYMRKLYLKAKDLGIKNIINTSSQSVYSINRSKPAKELDLLEPFNLYGLAKIYTEQYTKEFALQNNINYLNIRLASIVGPGFNQRIVNKLIKLYINNKNINLIEKKEKFSYLHVYDAVRAYIEIIINENLNWNRNINLGTAENYTITDIIGAIRKYIDFKYNAEVYIIAKKENLLTHEIDTQIMYNETNWKPKMYLKDIVIDIYKSIQKEIGGESV